MPFYEYECQACKYYTEVMQKISDAPLSRCPSCGKRRLKKLVSAPVFRLKGGGWYETDFKSDKESKRNLVGAEKEDAKADSKPETKPEPKEPKADAKEPKESKEAADVKPAQPKAADATAAAPRSRVSVAGKSVRRAARAARARSTRRSRR